MHRLFWLAPILLALGVAAFSVKGDGDGPIDTSFGDPVTVDCNYYTDGCQ